MGLLSRIGGAVATGGISEIARALGTSDTTVSQGPLRTPEQEAAQRALLAYGTSGNIGGYTTGTSYGGSFGDFDMSELEKLSGSRLTDLLMSGMPSSYTAGTQAVNDLLTTEKYNPLNAGGAYGLMQGTIDRNIRDAETAAKRSAAYTGNLYSSDAIRTLGDVQAKGVESKNSMLGQMFQNYISQKLGAIPQAFAGAQTGENISLGRIGAGYEGGALSRNLNTARDQAAYQDWLRARGETSNRVNALQSVSGANTQFGAPSVTLPGQSAWERLLEIGAQITPAALRAAAGGA